MAIEIKSQEELEEKLQLLGAESEGDRKRIACSLIGHSKIVTTFFGYIYCGRCGDQIGDNLTSIYNWTNEVVVGHNCDKCRENYATLTWKDKFMAPDPWGEDEIQKSIRELSE